MPKIQKPRVLRRNMGEEEAALEVPAKAVFESRCRARLSP